LLVPLDTLDEAQLTAQFREGSTLPRDEAFQELQRRHGNRLQQYLAAKGFSRPEREDIGAEAWMRVWRKLDRYEYREEAGYFPWLRQFADNVAREFKRKHYLSRGTDTLTPEIEDVTAAAVMNEPLVHLTREEVRKAIVDILEEGVPNDDWRIVIEAHLVDSWNTDDIIELHGWSRNKVYVTKLRALRWLKERLLERVGPTGIDAWLGD
jgi:RNA polymerase sigma factor (sigma-70 family)